MRRGSTILRIIILTPYLALLYIFQSTVFTHLTVFGAKPLILPLAVAGVALFRGRVDGGIFGLFAGILMDLAYNQNTIQFTLILALTGLLLGILSDTVIVQSFPSYLLICFLELAVCSAFQMLSLMVLRGAPASLLTGIAIRQSLATLIFTFPMYYISRFLCRVM